VLSLVQTITVKVDDRRRRMAQVAIHWSRYIRESIAERVEREEREKASRACRAKRIHKLDNSGSEEDGIDSPNG